MHRLSPYRSSDRGQLVLMYSYPVDPFSPCGTGGLPYVAPEAKGISQRMQRCSAVVQLDHSTILSSVPVLIILVQWPEAI